MLNTKLHTARTDTLRYYAMLNTTLHTARTDTLRYYTVRRPVQARPAEQPSRNPPRSDNPNRPPPCRQGTARVQNSTEGFTPYGPPPSRGTA